MTTNKPEVVAWGVPNSRLTERQPFMQLLHTQEGTQYPELLDPLIRLSDYEALQAECEALREALFEAQSTMTSALSFEPVINEVTKMTLRAEVERIKSLLSEGGNKS